jgi:hypothetical protein
VRFIDGLDVESEELRGGRATHAAIAEINLMAFENKDSMDMLDQKKWRAEFWASVERITLKQFSSAMKPEDNQEKYAEMVRTYILTLMARIKKLRDKNLPAIYAFPKTFESWVKSKDLAFRGIIDASTEWVAKERLYGEDWIVDYKTGAVSNVPFKFEHWLQLQMYAFAVYESTGKLPSGAAIWFLSSNAWALYDISLDSVAEAAAWVEYVREEIEAGHFEPTETPLCPWCLGKGDCPVATLTRDTQT